MIRPCPSQLLISSVSPLRYDPTRLPLAQSATFKSIKSVAPLLDRVLVQRFKAQTVSSFISAPTSSKQLVVWRRPLRPLPSRPPEFQDS